MIGDGPMQCETTNRCDFNAKTTMRPDLVIPCNNLRNADTPMDDKTTAKLSYMRPEPTEFVRSFKPVAQYIRFVPMTIIVRRICLLNFSLDYKIRSRARR